MEVQALTRNARMSGKKVREVARTIQGRKAPDAAPEARGEALPEDMSTASLIGGGLIAGESLYTLAIGIIALLGAL